VSGYLRIGELSRRTGVRPELLRAWEARYGLLEPDRSQGGFRLYGDEDERRVRAMQTRIAGGLSAAEAARVARTQVEVQPSAVSAVPHEAVEALGAALEAFDAACADAVLDRLLATFRWTTVICEVVLPYLREVGRRWERGEVTVAQEHFASTVLRGRLLGLARGWDQGIGPRAVLACPPREAHDLPLICFGLALRDHGWRVTLLGADTPLETLIDAVRRLEPALVVLSAATRVRFEGVADDLSALAGITTVAIAGRGATAQLAARCGAELLDGDPVAAASLVVENRGVGNGA
jgi:DNA-binding transcriptional MerR regulator